MVCVHRGKSQGWLRTLINERKLPVDEILRIQIARKLSLRRGEDKLIFIFRTHY